MKTISEQLAETAVGFFNRDLSQLPEDLIPAAKRCLLDSLGVTIGGYRSFTVLSPNGHENLGGKKNQP
jgi:2-methylcitrate dehydratase PrpD